MRLTVPLQDGHVRRDCEAGRWIVADWVEILREQRATGEQTGQQPGHRQIFAAVRVGIGTRVVATVDPAPEQRQERERRAQRDADQHRLGLELIDQRALREADDHHQAC